MLIAVIVACEIGFWVVLVAGLLARYVLRRRRLGGALLVCVPLVDLVLLVATVLDLRRGGTADLAHGLAALYLGFSVVFGHSMVQWADVRFAHRFAGGPPPEPKPPGGTLARLRLEWRTFGKASAAAGLSSTLLLGGVALVGSGSDTTALLWWIPRLALVLVIWLFTGPLWEAGRIALAPARAPDGEHAPR